MAITSHDSHVGAGASANPSATVVPLQYGVAMDPPGSTTARSTRSPLPPPAMAFPVVSELMATSTSVGERLIVTPRSPCWTTAICQANVVP